MKTAQEKQGYRVKSQQPVCGNCKNHAISPKTFVTDSCDIGLFPVDIVLGTCKLHEWRK